MKKLLLLFVLMMVLLTGCKKKCSEFACDKPVYKEGLCEMHYKIKLNEHILDLDRKISYYEGLLDNGGY